MAEELARTCTIAGSRLGYDLKKTIEEAKKHDFIGAAGGLVMLAQQAGTLETCGLKLKKELLINAVMALGHEHWDTLEEQLVAFGEDAYEKVMGPSPAGAEVEKLY